MNKFLNIRVAYPDVDGLNPQQEQEYIENVSRDVARQVVALINAERQRATIEYWQNKLLHWQIEDYNTDLKYKEYYEHQQRTSD